MALSATCLWASLNEVKPYFKLAVTDVGDDPVLEARANEVTEELERETGRIFVSRAFTETLDGPGTALLSLRAYPVATSRSTTVAASPSPTVNGCTVASAAGLAVGDAVLVTTSAGLEATTLTGITGAALTWAPAVTVAPVAGAAVAVGLVSLALDGTAVAATDYRLDAEGGQLWRTSGVWTAGVGNYVVSYTAGYARASVPASVVMLGIDLLRAKYLPWGANADVFSFQAQAGAGSIQMTDWVSIRKRIDALRHEVRLGVV